MTAMIHQIPATALADTIQEQLFGLMSANRSPFAGISKWPIRHLLIEERSQQILDRLGEEGWKDAGGCWDNGKPTLNPRSDSMEEMLQEVEKEYGGLLWRDHEGTNWALKLETIQHNGRRSRVGYAVTWGHSTPSGLDPIARSEFLDEARENGNLKTASNALKRNYDCTLGPNKCSGSPTHKSWLSEVRS